MESTQTMTPISVIISELRQRGISITSYTQLRRICRARWAHDRKNAEPQQSTKERYAGMEDWVEHREAIEQEEDFEILKRRR